MTLQEYKETIACNNFEEYPSFLPTSGPDMCEFINYSEADTRLKIHLAKIITCRSFSPTGGVVFSEDLYWFINNFLIEYSEDKIKPSLTNTIHRAISMIINMDWHRDRIIGTTFMFSVVEFYVKYNLGFRPFEYDFFDAKKKSYIKEHIPDNRNIKDIGLKHAFQILQGKEYEISKVLNEIDHFNLTRLRNHMIREERWIIVKISDRISLARNTILHGENHHFYEIGDYLVMLFILFHLHQL